MENDPHEATVINNFSYSHLETRRLRDPFLLLLCPPVKPYSLLSHASSGKHLCSNSNSVPLMLTLSAKVQTFQVGFVVLCCVLARDKERSEVRATNDCLWITNTQTEITLVINQRDRNAKTGNP